MHKRKIDMTDEIFVINVGGYIGESIEGGIVCMQSEPRFYPKYGSSIGVSVRNMAVC